ncbi:N-acetyltransferase [Sphingobacterium sp. N143]|nr:N-acetyltransferase [Sphingobacterium sp. N143]
MTINIRQEVSADHRAVFELVQRAFENSEHTDHQEQYLVEKLRQSAAFIPELSLVAEIDHQLVGYILLTRIDIVDDDNQAHQSLALAPIAVLPEFQDQGIGGKLIVTAHQIAKELGFGSVILLGHAAYYPKFGYQAASKYAINMPFDVPDENCMAIELHPGSLTDVKGMVVYPKEFGIA